MKKKLILAALLMSIAVTVFAEEEVVWEEQTAVEDAVLAENVFEEDDMSVEGQIVGEDPEYVFEDPKTIEEDTTYEESVFEEISFDEATEVVQEESVFEEEVTEELVTEEVSAVDESPAEQSSAVEGLVYTGEPQELIKYQDGSWTYSLDGEKYTSELPTAINAGEYTVYMKEGDGEPVVFTVTIAKADVIFTPPLPNTTEELSNTQLE